MVDDDDKGFGDFTFAPSNPTFHSNFTLINGRDSTFANDDDDWGDFVNSGGLSHAQSLPNFQKSLDPFKLSTDQKLNNMDSEPTHPGSALIRVKSGSMAQWVKPEGALPLSIFGDQEEEEEPAATDTSFGDGGASLFFSRNVDSVKKGSVVNVNNLLANLYQQGDLKNGSIPDLNGSNSIDKTNKNELDSDLNINKLGVVEPNLNSDAPDSSWNWVNTNAIDLNASGINELKLNSQESNFNWDPLDLNSIALNSNEDGTNSGAKDAKSSANGSNMVSFDTDERFDNGDDDDDGWEFKDAQPVTLTDNEISKTSQIKTENGPLPNLNGFNSSWNALSLDFNGWNSNVNVVNSNTNSLNMENKEVAGGGDGDGGDDDHDDDDGWEFKGADFELQVGDDKNSQIKTEHMTNLNFNGSGSSWDVFRSDSSGFEPSQVKLDKKQFNSKLIDEKKEASVANGWAFNSAEQEFQVKDGISKIKTENGPTLNSNGTNSSWSKLSLDGSASSNLNGANLETKQANLDLFNEYGNLGGNNGWELITTESAFGPRDGNTKGNMVRVDNHKGALPLSIFGDEAAEDDPVIYQVISSSTQVSTSDQRDGIKSSHLNISINDLISSLYIQAEQNASDNHEQNLSENGLDSTKTMMASNLANANIVFDDDSWEFQDASTGARAEDHTVILESNTKYNTQTELNDYVEFFSKLKEELHYVALCHLENLKKAQSAVALTGEDAKVQALDKEIQDLNDELHRDGIISSEIHSESHSPGNICLDTFIEVLHETKFQVFESECQFTKKLTLAESDFRSTIELLKYVDLTLKILTLVPREDQYSYISAWSKMLSVCAQELRHGAFIWKQSLQKNVHDKILSKPEGKKYVLALGEIYRVVEVLGSSAKLYKPWILASSTDPMCIFTLLTECSSLWSNSRLEEALQIILSSADFEYNGSLKTSLESIKHIHDLDAHTLYNHVFSGQGPTCQLSALSAGTVPGMKTVVWNEEHCFLTLANLWANLVSSDPPILPSIHVG